jgi:type I restriction enzyme S subunit
MKVPDGWSVSTLDECVSDFIDYRGKSPPKSDSGVPLLTARHIKAGFLDLTEPEFIGEEDYGSWMSRGHPKPGDILFTTEAPLGNVAEYPSTGRYALAQRVLALRGMKDVLYNGFLKQFLLSGLGRSQVELRSSGSTAIGIKQSELRRVAIPLPPVQEQRKIAGILGTWDEALEKLDMLIAAKARLRAALLRQMLTGTRRLPGFDQSSRERIKDPLGSWPSDWQKIALGEITREVSARAGTGNSAPVLSCTIHRGLVRSEEYFGKRVYAADTSNYKLVRRGDFAYATNHIEEGSIGHQREFDVGLVSPIYTIFQTVGETDDRYLFRLLKSPLLIHLYQINTIASVDRRGSLRYCEFAKIRVWLPRKAEQAAIADVLDACDDELRLLRNYRGILACQKRGLMQGLLSGEIRARSDQSSITR